MRPGASIASQVASIFGQARAVGRDSGPALKTSEREKFQGLQRWDRFHSQTLTTSEHGGIALATHVSHKLGVPLAVASPNKSVGVQKHWETEFLSTEPYCMRTLYLPKGDLRVADQVIIVTATLSDGAIQVALEQLVRKSTAETTSIYAITAAGHNWRKTVEDAKIACPVKFFAEIKAG